MLKILVADKMQSRVRPVLLRRFAPVAMDPVFAVPLVAGTSPMRMPDDHSVPMPLRLLLSPSHPQPLFVMCALWPKIRILAHLSDNFMDRWK
jgi:hypothetical protein